MSKTQKQMAAMNSLLLKTLKQVQRMVSSADFHDQDKRLAVWNAIDQAISLSEGRGELRHISETTDEIISSIQHGFDLTEISAANFRKILRELDIDQNAKVGKETGGWEFKGPGILIVTGNNPITGKYSRKGQREDEVGYASYIGIEGDPEKVKKVARMIKKLATYIKDEDKTKRQFI